MTSRRAISLSLPSGDPRSRRIVQWLDGLPAAADQSAELRRLICLALDVAGALDRQAAQLAAIQQHLATLAAAPAPPPGRPLGDTVPPALSDEDAAALDMLLGDFG